MSNRVLVVNDLPGAGKVAANINLPVLAAAQLEVTLLPTLLLSTYASGRGQVVRHKLGDDFKAMLLHWEEIEVAFSLYLTGYFADAEQIKTIHDHYAKCKKVNQALILVVDPIMGDLGKFYKGFDQEVADQMMEFISLADVVMPNVTEACLMTGYPYREDLSLDEIYQIAKKLLETGVQHVVITGVHPDREHPTDEIGFYLLSRTGYSELFLHRHFERRFYGTGDLAGSLVAAYLSTGMSIQTALISTGRMMERVLDLTTERYNGTYDDHRLCLEPMLLSIAQELFYLREGV